MTIKVYVRENFATGNLEVWVARIGDGFRDILRADGLWERNTDRAAAPVSDDDGPSYRLSEDVARPLLSALLRHFDGSEDTRNLRRDYDAERARVDKMLGVVSAIAQREGGRP